MVNAQADALIDAGEQGRAAKATVCRDQLRPPQQIALKPLAEAQIVASSAPRYGAHNWDYIAMAW